MCNFLSDKGNIGFDVGIETVFDAHISIINVGGKILN